MIKIFGGLILFTIGSVLMFAGIGWFVTVFIGFTSVAIASFFTVLWYLLMGALFVFIAKVVLVLIFKLTKAEIFEDELSEEIGPSDLSEKKYNLAGK